MTTVIQVTEEEIVTTKDSKIVNTKPKCRGQHVHDHNWNATISFCDFCKAKVQYTADRHCMCCSSKLAKEKDGLVFERILNKMLSRYADTLERYMYDPYPPTEPHYLRVHHGLWLYEIELKYLALYAEMNQLDRKPFPAPIKVTKSGKKIQDGLDIEKIDRFELGDSLDDKESKRQSKFYDKYNRDEAVTQRIKKHAEMLRVAVEWGNKHLS